MNFKECSFLKIQIYERKYYFERRISIPVEKQLRFRPHSLLNLYLLQLVFRKCVVKLSLLTDEFFIDNGICAA